MLRNENKIPLHFSSPCGIPILCVSYFLTESHLLEALLPPLVGCLKQVQLIVLCPCAHLLLVHSDAFLGTLEERMVN